MGITCSIGQYYAFLHTIIVTVLHCEWSARVDSISFKDGISTPYAKYTSVHTSAVLHYVCIIMCVCVCVTEPQYKINSILQC